MLLPRQIWSYHRETVSLASLKSPLKLTDYQVTSHLFNKYKNWSVVILQGSWIRLFLGWEQEPSWSLSWKLSTHLRPLVKNVSLTVTDWWCSVINMKFVLWGRHWSATLSQVRAPPAAAVWVDPLPSTHWWSTHRSAGTNKQTLKNKQCN